MSPLVFGDGLPSPQAFDIRKALAGLSARTSGVAYLKIVNSSEGAVRLYKGTEMVYNTVGISYMPNNSVATEFEIYMPGSKDKFDEFITINNYMVGPTGGAVAIVDQTGNKSLKLYADKSYTVTVTGDYNTDDIKAVIDMEHPTDVSFDFFTFIDD
jgi:hypothetical protein